MIIIFCSDKKKSKKKTVQVSDSESGDSELEAKKKKKMKKDKKKKKKSKKSKKAKHLRWDMHDTTWNANSALLTPISKVKYWVKRNSNSDYCIVWRQWRPKT